MRKITQQSIGAFVGGQDMRSGNMSVSTHHGIEGFHVSLYLHGNLIAESVNGTTTLSDAGWQTTTTKERLNGLLRAIAPTYGIFQKAFTWYIQRDGETAREWRGTASFHNGELIQ